MAVKQRSKNSGRQSSGPDKESPFVNTPWGKEQDVAFDAWLEQNLSITVETCIQVLLDDGLTAKVGTHEQSCYCTIDSPEAKEAGSKHLLSGWSDSLAEAVLVAFWKWDQLIGRNFEHPFAVGEKSRRR